MTMTRTMTNVSPAPSVLLIEPLEKRRRPAPGLVPVRCC